MGFYSSNGFADCSQIGLRRVQSRVPLQGALHRLRGEDAMAFVQFTRPDDSPVVVNSVEVNSFAPVPPDGPLAGPLKKGTRINFRNGHHQAVKQLVPEVPKRLNV